MNEKSNEDGRLSSKQAEHIAIIGSYSLDSSTWITPNQRYVQYLAIGKQAVASNVGDAD